MEQALADTGVPHAIARPAVLFGGNGVLINNIAWLLRRLPVFAIGGGGDYRLRPIHVDDLASLCADLGARTGDVVVDAVGPQSLTFRQLVEEIRAAVGSHSVIVPVPGALVPPLAAVLNLALRDTLLTARRIRVDGGRPGRLDCGRDRAGRLTDWVREHGDQLGRSYANELDLHFRRGPGLARRA